MFKVDDKVIVTVDGEELDGVVKIVKEMSESLTRLVVNTTDGITRILEYNPLTYKRKLH